MSNVRPRLVVSSLILAGASLGFARPAAAADAPFPELPSADVTNVQDRDQMLWQLGLALPALPPKLEDPNAPPGAKPAKPDQPDGNWLDASGNIVTRSTFGLWNNYDDRPGTFFPGPHAERVGDYAPIDLLAMDDGTRVTTADQWWHQRRPELMQALRDELYGHIPAQTPKVAFSAVTTKGTADGVDYVQREITGAIDTSGYPAVRDVPKVRATLRVPANAPGPVPVMIIFGGNLDRYFGWTAPQGWGVCIFDPGALQPDRDGGRGLTSYLIGLCNRGQWRKPGDWGALAAWSWGIGRLLDYLETDPLVDAKKVGLAGHSRYGKATIVAMAFEPRLAVAFPSEAGALGTSMVRRHWGQDLENSGWDREYHWMAGNFFNYMGPLHPGAYLPRKVANLRVDAHALLAMCAPRPVFINGGNHDSWSDPWGCYLTCVGATPVYALLGARGLVMPDPMPQLQVAYLGGDIGYRYHDGGHTDQLDWPAFIEFAKAHFAPR
ncbi:MAG TPA: hypothetical protein VHE13_06960 [Opitutus sp.]|nr:hypothetical protein [Opitutus sp.]